MKLYINECKAQDRFQLLASEFQTYSIVISDLKGFKIPKALGKSSYFFEKNDFLNRSEISMAKNSEWQTWNKGQKFIKNLSPAYLDLNDILKLHKSFLEYNKVLDLESEAGKLRTRNAETNPKVSISCSDKILNKKLFKSLSYYDLSSVEGYPLLRLENVVTCDDFISFSADIYFYKGASVKAELNRWTTDLNDMLTRYELGDGLYESSPYEYLSDMRRWFLAIKPFNVGNEQLIDALLDYSTKRMGLPSLPSNDSLNPYFLSVDENRSNTMLLLKDSLNFFEGCLFETKIKLISSECSAIK